MSKPVSRPPLPPTRLRRTGAWARLAIAGVATLATPAPGTAAGGAAPGQSLDAVARQAEAAVHAALPDASRPARSGDAPRIRVTARAPDPRLRLAGCAEPLEGRLMAAAGGVGARNLVQVRCPAPTRWTVLVPVTVETEATVLVAGRALLRGTAPGSADVVQARRVVPGFSSGYISNLDELSGFHLARPVAAGSPLTRDMLAADPRVRRGESVTLVAQVGGLEIRAPGRALADARPGEPVRVQNVNSLKVVEGRADNAGMVRVDP